MKRIVFMVSVLCTLNILQAQTGSPKGIQHSTKENYVFAKYFKLLPKPQKIEFLAGKGFMYNDLKFLHLEGLQQSPVLDYPLNALPFSDARGKGILTLILTESDNLPSSSEGYILEINDNQIIITARKEAGLFYGCQTLLQLLQDGRDQQKDIPPCKITDYPGISYRAVHLDLKHHLDAGHYYYEMIDRLAHIKINAIIVEFEDKLRYRKAPLVGAGNAISIEEFAAISRYAKERNIEISPLVQGLGHASFILKHDEYKKLRDNPASDWVFDPLNPETYDLQFSLYEDAITATPYGKYLHVGGDEVDALGFSELSKKSGKKPFELQMYWLNKVCEFAQKHNRIPIFWDDMVFELSGLYKTTYDSRISKDEIIKIWKENEHRLDENIGLFPKNCIYMRWNYDNPDITGNLKAIDWFKTHDLKVMAATAAQTGWAMLPRNNSNFKPIKDYCWIASDKKMDGILCTAWDDCSPHFETYWRGLYDFALLSWNYQDIKVDVAHALFRHRFYAPALSDVSFEFEDLMEEALAFWETALIDKGGSARYESNYPRKFELLTLPDPEKAGAWSEKHMEKITGAEKELSRYTVIKDRIGKASKLARRNHYSLALLKEINELQIYPANLLLLLQKYDKTIPIADKKAVQLQIQKYVNSFGEIRRHYEETFSKTRMLKNPDGYILNQNNPDHSHLANSTANNDWMYVDELAMNNKINSWLAH
jgi:hexosaminidase